jgi:alanine racemase
MAVGGRPSWAEIDLAALRRNLRSVRALARDRAVIAVVKANAYGHGAGPVARALEDAGTEMLAVATIDEARELREAGVRTPILLLEGLHSADETEAVLELELTVPAGRADTLQALESAGSRAGRRLPVHVKVDTGMGRLGFVPEEIGDVLDGLRRCSNVELVGVATHLAEADDSGSNATEEQRRRFGDVVASVRAAGFDPRWVHADNSAGVVHGGTPIATAVRPGILLYGPDPTLEGGNGLEPVMSVVTRVMQAKDLPVGSHVGYGGTYVTAERTRILTVPFGYADGLPRNAGGQGFAGVRGQRVPLVGRVSMDLATLDAGPGSKIDAGEEVLLFGRRAELTLPVDDLAAACGTIAYEILVRVGPRVPRVPRDDR